MRQFASFWLSRLLFRVIAIDLAVVKFVEFALELVEDFLSLRITEIIKQAWRPLRLV